MNEQSSWDLPLPKQHTNANNKQVLGQKPMEKKDPEELPPSLTKDNIFSQSDEFYARINKTHKLSPVNSNFSCSITAPSSSIPKKNEPGTTQLINLLNTLGINLNATEFKPTEQQLNSIDICNEIVLRAKQGTYFANYTSKNLEDQMSSLVCKENNVSFFTKDGNSLMVADNYNVVMYSLKTKNIVNKITKQFQIVNIGISSKPNYIISVDKIDKENFVLSVLDFMTLTTKYEANLLKHKRDHWPLMKFNNEDSVAFKKVSFDSIEILDAVNNFEVLKVCKLDRFNYFYVSPRTDKLSIVFTFVEHAQGFDKNNSKLSICDFDDLSKPVFVKNLEKAQEINPIFSPDGHKLLILTQTYTDESGKSYYGETSLYYYDMELKQLKKVPTYEGPIHDVSWNPNSEQFIVISGFMPAASVLFDKTCKPIFEFGKHHRNTIRWSPVSRYVILGGFGNLSGEIEIWDCKKFEKIGSCKSNSAVSCIWAPDGKKFLTGVLNPRLRVDNNFKVFKYDGKLLNSMDLSSTELYEVDWRPSNMQFFEFNPSPKLHDHKEEKKEEKPRKLFKPKGTGQLSAILKAEKQTQGARALKHDENFGNDNKNDEKNSNSGNNNNVMMVKYPPGYIPPEPKKKKKRNRKKKDGTNPDNNINEENINEEEDNNEEVNKP